MVAGAGYSGTPLPKKLGIKEGHRVCFPGAPDGFAATLGPLGGSVRTLARLPASFNAGSATRLDVIVAFFDRRRRLEARLPTLMEALDVDGGLWIAWPKRASGVATDITEDEVRALALAHGMVDNKVCAIDDVWSGLRIVYRLANRQALAAKRS